MIDLHIHILPDLDDGAANLEQSLEMARRAWEHGTKKIVATVHSYARRGFYELLPEDIAGAAASLREKLSEEGIALTVETGMEVLLEARTLPLLADRRLLTLGSTRWLLIEFCGEESPNEITALLKKVISMGYTPLIAHAERYRAIQKHLELASHLHGMGCAIQVNARSLTGESDRRFVKTARRLCERGYVHAVASDAHNSTTRSPDLKGVYDWLSEQYSPSLADLLTCINPQAIMDGASPDDLKGSF